LIKNTDKKTIKLAELEKADTKSQLFNKKQLIDKTNLINRLTLGTDYITLIYVTTNVAIDNVYRLIFLKQLVSQKLRGRFMAIKQKIVSSDLDQRDKKHKFAKDEDVFRILAKLEKEYEDVLSELAK
jgi:hypothetical protein